MFPARLVANGAVAVNAGIGQSRGLGASAHCLRGGGSSRAARTVPASRGRRPRVDRPSSPNGCAARRGAGFRRAKTATTSCSRNGGSARMHSRDLSFSGRVPMCPSDHARVGGFTGQCAAVVRCEADAGPGWTAHSLIQRMKRKTVKTTSFLGAVPQLVQFIEQGQADAKTGLNNAT